MRDLFWRLSLTLLALAGLVLLGLDPSLGVRQAWGDAPSGDTPRVCVDAFLQAVEAGDAEASLALWRQNPRLGPAFGARRVSVVDRLLSLGPHLTYRVQGQEWWRTCCEPGVVQDRDQADGARLWVALSSPAGPVGVYVVDLVASGSAGEVEGDRPSSRWEIVDVYPEGEPPMALVWQAGAE